MRASTNMPGRRLRAGQRARLDRRWAMKDQEQVAREERVEKLPALRVVIRGRGGMKKAVYIADPRQEYMEAFNERCNRMGMTASLN